MKLKGKKIGFGFNYSKKSFMKKAIRTKRKTEEFMTELELNKKPFENKVILRKSNVKS